MAGATGPLDTTGSRQPSIGVPFVSSRDIR